MNVGMKKIKAKCRHRLVNDRIYLYRVDVNGLVQTVVDFSSVMICLHSV